MKLGTKSTTILNTCHKDLRILVRAVSARCTQLKLDFSVTSGHRGKALQQRKLREKTSTLGWPNSKHNSEPSRAVHMVPYPIRWPQKGTKDEAKLLGRFYLLAGVVISVAKEKKIKIRGGYDWDRDGDIMDQSFDDLAHWELV